MKSGYSKSSFVGTLVILCCLLLVVYSPVLKGQFLNWDDDVHLVKNPAIRALDWPHLKEIWTQKINKTYNPLTIQTFALEYHFFGELPFIYHLNNLILHILVAILIFFFSLQLGLPLFMAGLVAILFGLHPSRVESVAWITERKDVLYAFFYMASVLSYQKYLEDLNNPSPSRRKTALLLLTTLLGLMSILAKPMALSLPLILFLLDWYKRRPFSMRGVVEKIPLIAGFLAIGWITYMEHARFPIRSILEAVLVSSWSFVFYLRQFFFPILFVPIYFFPQPVALSHPEYFLSVIVILLLIIAGIRYRARRPWIFGMAFFFLSIFFLIRFDTSIDTNIVADRYMYLPSLGLCLLTAFGARWVFEHPFSQRRNYLKPVLAGCLLMILFSWGTKVYRMSHIWQTSLSLWSYQLYFFPDEPIALNNLATALRDEKVVQEMEKTYARLIPLPEGGDWLASRLNQEEQGAIVKVEKIKGLYGKAIRLQPDYSDAYYNLGNLFFDLGLYQQAIEQYQTALSYHPQTPDIHFNLARALMNVGEYQQAFPIFDQVLKVSSQKVEAFVQVIQAYIDTYAKVKKDDQPLLKQVIVENLKRFVSFIGEKAPLAVNYLHLGNLYDSIGEYRLAILAYQKAIELRPRYTDALYNLAGIYKKLNQLPLAIELYEKVIQLNPRFVNAHQNLGVIYSLRGEVKKAEEAFSTALRLEPENPDFNFNLGYISETSGQLSESTKYYQKAVESNPHHIEAYYNLGNVFAALKKYDEAVAAYLTAVQLNPNHLNALINLSTVYYYKGDYPLALRYCDEARLLGYDPPQEYLRILESYH